MRLTYAHLFRAAVVVLLLGLAATASPGLARATAAGGPVVATPSFTGTPPTAVPTATGTPPTSTSTRTPSPLPTRLTATPGPTGCWSIVAGPAPAPYHGLYGLAAVSANDVWGVGTYFNNGYRALIEHWDGGAWSVVPGPDPRSNDELYSVAAVAADDVWAVGATDYTYYSPPLIEHWNGSTWSAVPVPGTGALRAVTALAADDVWAVGYVPGGNSSSLILHWDGATWQQVAAPNPGQDNYLWSLAASGPTDIWAAGYSTDGGLGRTLTIHWDGLTWQTIPSPNLDSYSNTFHGVTVAGPNDAWAVGESVVNGTLIAHWDGAGWTIVPSPNPGGGGQIFGVTAVNWDNIWAVGRYPNGPNTEQALILHWDGNAWAQVESPWAGNSSELEAVAAAGPLDIWSVASPNAPLIEHYSPFCPTATPTPIPPSLTPTVTGTPPTVRPTPTATGAPPPPTGTHPPTGTPVGATVTPLATNTRVPTATPPGSPTGTAPALSPTATAPPSATPPPTSVAPTATPPPTTMPTAAPTGTVCAATFGDVHPADYFYTPVRYLACHGAISGYGDGTFRPYSQTTRAQMVKIVVLGFQKPMCCAPPSVISTPSGGAYTFTDVPPTFPFFAVIETAAADGIVSGYGCGGPGEPCDPQGRPYFRPYPNVTRGQLSKITVAAAGWALQNPPAGTFADVLPGAAFYIFVETAACHGVVSGYACGGPGEPCDPARRPYFRQYSLATRGQIAKIVYGALTGGGACPPR